MAPEEPVQLRTPPRNSLPATRIVATPPTPPRPCSLPAKQVRPLPTPPAPPLPSPPLSAVTSPKSPRPLPAVPQRAASQKTVIRKEETRPDDVFSDPGPSRSLLEVPVLLTPPLKRQMEGRRPTNSRPKLRIQTRPKSRSSFASSMASASPAVPAPPTPLTARKKRMSKLRRHLGSGVPDETIFLSTLRKLADKDFFHKDGGSDSDKEQLPRGVEGAHKKSSRGHISIRRYSGKWLREKRGQRREESNYAAVLRALRTL